MKRKSLVLFGVVIALGLSNNSVRANEEKSIYAPYTSFEEVSTAYYQAVEEGDAKKQEQLLAIAERSLEIEIQESEVNSKQLRIDPDEAYWRNQFPTYFSYGRFLNRSDGVTLALGPINRGVWTSTQKSNGWNSVYAKFYRDSRWKNTEMMKKQFYCHARLGYSSIEEEWNLEPWRTSMNAVTCN